MNNREGQGVFSTAGAPSSTQYTFQLILRRHRRGFSLSCDPSGVRSPSHPTRRVGSRARAWRRGVNYALTSAKVSRRREKSNQFIHSLLSLPFFPLFCLLPSRALCDALPADLRATRRDPRRHLPPSNHQCPTRSPSQRTGGPWYSFEFATIDPLSTSLSLPLDKLAGTPDAHGDQPHL